VSRVALKQVTKRYGDTFAVRGLDLDIREGEFLTLLGPSGCGKTTTLRMIAGFVLPSSGTVYLGDEDVTRLPPNKRDIGMVFQDYALFPHMSVIENVAYGLKMRGVPTSQRLWRARAMLELVRLADYGARRPAQLSGGQKQRVALARALINEPKVLLLDEPLGALDLKLREDMQTELKSLQKRLGITFVFVTHDQGEALSMADRVAVFSQGRVEQLDTPRELYNRPRTAFVASFVGSANVIGAEIAQRLTGRAQAFAIRPEMIEVLATGVPIPDGSVHCEGQLQDVLYHGASSRVHVRVDEQTTLAVARAESSNPPALPMAAGETVRLAWRPEHAVPLQG